MTEEEEKLKKEAEEKAAEEKAAEEKKAAEPSPTLEEAKAINAEKKDLLDREEILQTRKEKLHAEEMVSGKGVMQQGQPQKSEEEQASDARVKEIGQATGAAWAEKM